MMKKTKSHKVLVVGLGNPDEQYQKTRHNAGWLAIDYLAEHMGALGRQKTLKHSLVQENVLDDDLLILIKPTTYMNESGLAVKEAIAKFGEPTILVVIHDDIDLAFDTVKLQTGRSSAGHKGVESIIKTLGNQDFFRARIGVSKPIGKVPVDAYVLQKFTATELKQLPAVFERILDKLSDILK